MDSSEKIKRAASPWKTANIVSKLLFLFAYPTFRKSLKTELQEKDIFEVLNSGNSAKLGCLLEDAWNKEKIKKSPNILFPMFRVFGTKLIWLGIGYLFINTSLLMATPYLKGKVVSYFNPNQKELSETEAYYYVATLLLCTFLNSVFVHGYMFCIEQLTWKTKTGICALLYRKLLRLDSILTSQVASGKLITLITKDINTFNGGVFLLNKLWIGFIQVFVMAYLMYVQIGISALIGASTLCIGIPLQAYLGSRTAKYKRKSLEKADERVKITQEVLTAIRIIKMYTWELFFSDRIGDIRKKEIRNLKILIYIKRVIFAISTLNYRISLFICIISYVSFGNHITSQKAFTVIGYFSVLRITVSIFVPAAIALTAELQVALRRMTKFMLLKEVENLTNHKINNTPDITLKNVNIKFNKEDLILNNITLHIKSGLTLLTGPLGSGKSTLLKVILGELRGDNEIVETPHKISLASQEPWLFPGTIRQNIIFNEELDEARYNKVVYVCALRRDFDELPHGDKTIVTDKGLNLSRGQKTRVNLARAVYSNSDVYLLDDCLSSIDSNVGKHIFQNCIKQFLKDKICVLVTYQNKFLQDADSIIVLNKGSVAFQGDFAKLKDSNLNDLNIILTKSDYNQKNEAAHKASLDELDDEAENNELVGLLSYEQEDREKNIYGEKNESGSVKNEVYLNYFKAGGGFIFAFVIVALFVIAQAFESWSDYFVSYWVDMEQKLSEYRLNETMNSSQEYYDLQHSYENMLKLYFLAICLAVAFTIIRTLVFYVFTSRASINVHNSILTKIINAEMIFFDMNLSGNVLNRFSRDMGIVDEPLPNAIFECIRITLMLLGTVYVITSVHAIFLVFSIIFCILLIFARHLYLKTARSVKRLEGSTRSPVIGHLNATLDGLLTIRSNHAQQILTDEYDKHLNLYNSCVHMTLFTERAFGFYLDNLCILYISCITISFLLFKTDTLAGKVGLAITQAFSLTGITQWLVRQWADLETYMTSVERVAEYDKITTENKQGMTPSNWPEQGTITYNNVYLKYFENSDYVLKDISFTIQSKHKIGIVGRTGAGKSSIISTLFKMYKFEGGIFIDGIDTNTVSVEYLRSIMCIIPQDPVLFSGTIRSNLDPYNKYDDKLLWDALDDVGLKTTIDKLDAPIDTDGLNFSVGQKQLLSLARAILQSNIILVLDEATANMDPQTDLLIQEIIKNKFVNCTVITIAHRLNTIMKSDRILVLDSGRIIEYDHPDNLMKNKNSMFRNIVNDSNL